MHDNFLPSPILYVLPLVFAAIGCILSHIQRQWIGIVGIVVLWIGIMMVLFQSPQIRTAGYGDGSRGIQTIQLIGVIVLPLAIGLIPVKHKWIMWLIGSILGVFTALPTWVA